MPSRNLDPAGGGSIAARMETNCDEVRSASPSTFTLSTGRNNRLSLLSGPLAERTRSPPPSYDGLTGLLPQAGSPLRPDHDVSATLDAHLPLTISNKGWSEVESVSKQFLAENLPGWISSMQDSGDHGAKPNGQQKQLSQLIRAGIRKSHKGLVLRLLRRTPDSDEIADLRLHDGTRPHASHGPEPLPELEATQPSKVVHQIPGLHEAPSEPMVHELPAPATRVPRQAEEPPGPQARQQTPMQEGAQDEIVLPAWPTHNLLRALSFGPEEASAWSEPVIDSSDSDHSPPSSIVPTPTKGLSVRHATHRVVRRPRLGEASAAASAPPLDVECLNRRLLESSEHASAREDRRENVAASTGTTTGEAAGRNEQALCVEKSLANEPTSKTEPGGVPDLDAHQTTAETSAPHARDMQGHGRAEAERARPKADSTPAEQEQAGAAHCLAATEAPRKLQISTSCGSGPTGAVESAPASGPVVLRQEGSRARPDHGVYTATPLMHEQGEATQGTIDGSVTLPTLNVPVPEPEPEPDSPGGSLWLPSNTEIRPSPATRSPLRSLVSHASKAAVAQIGRVAAGLYELYGPEKPVPKDHVRVRWTCTCGRQLHDDFIERRRGAARELEAYLNRPRAHTAPSSPSHSANSSFSEPGQIFSSNPSLSASPATTWGSLGTAGDSSPASYSPNTLRSNNPFSVRVGTLPPPRWLLTCADEGQFTAKLSHVDVTETRVRSDKDLAMAVRGLYSHVNRRWWRLLRLRGLTSIDFVQFEVHRNRVVDIRKCPDMPPKQTGYDFEPHDLVPPVGAQYLMHLFAHPEDYDSEFITYARAPKKRNARLDVGVGWGINLVEGFLADRVWMLVMGFFVLGSTVFAVVWACKRGEDVQGAFGVASWMLTLAVLFVGWAQASLG